MRKTLSLLAAAAAVAVSFPATPASADSYCFGAPSEPLTYVCIVVGPGTGPGTEPQTQTETVTVPSVCYGVGCTPSVSRTVTYPSVSVTALPSPGSVSVEWGGQEYIYELEPLFQRISELLPE